MSSKTSTKKPQHGLERRHSRRADIGDPVGKRHEFWAHEQLEDTDDPFEDDFGEEYSKPLKN